MPIMSAFTFKALSMKSFGLQLIPMLWTLKPAPIKDTISIDDLDKIDIRVGQIVEIVDVPESRKLVRLSVDFGDHRRTILAGIKQEREDPTQLRGKQALFVVNLAAREMAGVISEGMLLDIGYPDGIVPVLASPEIPVPNGSRAG